jgi:hypothetical protein
VENARRCRPCRRVDPGERFAAPGDGTIDQGNGIFANSSRAQALAIEEAIMTDKHDSETRPESIQRSDEKARREREDIAPTEPDPAEGSNDVPPARPGSAKG